MKFDLNIIQKVYNSLPGSIDAARKIIGRPLTFAEKMLYTHLFDPNDLRPFERAIDYVNFRPDRVAMQDATAQMALLQFMNAGREKSAVPASVHCDHLIQADEGAHKDIETANIVNSEVYAFLKDISNRFGIGFWKPGAGIIHQVVLENYAFPGGMMIGTDSHTPNAGGLGMLAIGVGGADAVDVMAGMPWELKMPQLIGIKLSGKLNGWCSAKDVILKVAGILTVKGGTNAIIEYFGEGAKSLSATGKGTICNMGAEVGATTSVFGYDEAMSRYLRATGREEAADMADSMASHLTHDPEVEIHPEQYFDRLIEIDLNTLEPYINGPFTPDAAHPLSEFASIVKSKGYPRTLEVGLVGSCTNSSYQDLGRAASVARQATEKSLKAQAPLLINPGSELVRFTAERDGFLSPLLALGGVIMANACGPCIGQWHRHTDDNARPNSILTSFNRNFAKRTDGNPNTHNFVASPEIVTALTLAGDLCFNPMLDRLLNQEGKWVLLDEPTSDELPSSGFSVQDAGYIAPATHSENIDINIAPHSKRLQKLVPFDSWSPLDFDCMNLLIKASGKCTTDHISMAGPWLKFRGHLENISDNLLMGAVNAFNGRTNEVLNQLSGTYEGVSTTAKSYKSAFVSSVIVAEENYGEGSSREHAALEPRFLNVKVVLVKSFARIHETNLKKQGMLALTFTQSSDYDKIREDDQLSVSGLEQFSPGKSLKVILHHSDGTEESFDALHSYNDQQIAWFKAGSALNLIKHQNK